MRFARHIALGVALSPLSAAAQQLSVQQPVVSSFSAGTTLSVPDRGTAYVGGVGRARGTWSRNGFMPGRGAYGRGISASSLSSVVSIHDLAAMDAAVLSAAAGTRPRPVFTKSRYDDATSYAMHDRFVASRRRQPAGRVERPNTPLTDAKRFLTLGEVAERRGQPGVAAIHYRVAAKQGSIEAEKRLTNLAGNSLVARP